MPAAATPADPGDEARHQPGDEPLWAESWYLDFVDADNAIAGYVRLSIQPELGRAWYWACVVGPDRPLVTVIDHDVALPREGAHEIRSEGLWADYTVETPLDHVSVGLEAFAVGVDDPAAAIRTQSAVYLDGLGWRPPRGEFDEDAAARRIRSLLEAPTDAPPTS